MQQLYMKQLLKAGIRLEDKEELDVQKWLLPDDVSPFSRKRPAGGVISLPKKRTRVTLTPNAESKLLYNELNKLSGEWYDDRGSSYLVRIAKGKGYVAKFSASRNQRLEKAMITVATGLGKITWQNPNGEDPPIYELCIEDDDRVTWTWFAGDRPKYDLFVWTRVRVSCDKLSF